MGRDGDRGGIEMTLTKAEYDAARSAPSMTPPVRNGTASPPSAQPSPLRTVPVVRRRSAPPVRPPEPLSNVAPADGVELPDVAIHTMLPGELHRRLRIRAIERGLSLKQAMIAAARAWVEDAD